MLESQRLRVHSIDSHFCNKKKQQSVQILFDCIFFYHYNATSILKLRLLALMKAKTSYI